MKKKITNGLMLTLPVALIANGLTVKNVVAQQCYPWNDRVDIVVTLEGPSNDLDWNECAFVVSKVETKEALPVSHVTSVERQCPGHSNY